MQDNKEKEPFSFINEKIKEKPINKRRMLIYAGYVMGLAVLFGVIASLVFALLEPRLEEGLHPQEDPVVTIPRDDLASTEETEAVDIETEETETEPEGETTESGETETPEEEPRGLRSRFPESSERALRGRTRGK